MNNVVDRQGLNDQAMAAIFKIMKLDFSLTSQDERDRVSIYLMGLTGKTAQPLQRGQGALFDSTQPSIRVSTPNKSPNAFLDTNNSILTPQLARHTTSSDGHNESRARASTRIPIDLAIDGKDNSFKPNNIISMNKNCLTHSDAQHNDTIMKAFKMACLNYQPSPVEFENHIYKR